MGEQIINCIHNDPEGCIFIGIIFLLGVWTTGIVRIVRNNMKAKSSIRMGEDINDNDKESQKK